jgi:hypothetical protein
MAPRYNMSIFSKTMAADRNTALVSSISMRSAFFITPNTLSSSNQLTVRSAWYQRLCQQQNSRCVRATPVLVVRLTQASNIEHCALSVPEKPLLFIAL